MISSKFKIYFRNFQSPVSVGIEVQKEVDKLVYVKQGIIAKRFENLENMTCETICIKLTVSKKNDVLYLHIDPTIK